MKQQPTILAVTSWGGACGIAEYARMVIEHQPTGGAAFWSPGDESLDPAWVATREKGSIDLLWLNYHRGLHSRWTPEVVASFKKHAPVVITFHDTYGESAPDPLALQLHDLADAFIVHEPCEGLPKAQLIRQGVLAAQPAVHYAACSDPGGYYFKAFDQQPVLGTCGFNFPWKNFDRLCELTYEAGWAIVILSNNATPEDVARWQAKNPHSLIRTGFHSASDIVAHLAGCDASAFPYECSNSGTSGAIRLGLAARKPVIALSSCRQFRDLVYIESDTCHGVTGVRWLEHMSDLLPMLAHMPIQRCAPGVVWHAHRDSWVKQGARYAEIFRSLL